MKFVLLLGSMGSLAGCGGRGSERAHREREAAEGGEGHSSNLERERHFYQDFVSASTEERRETGGVYSRTTSSRWRTLLLHQLEGTSRGKEKTKLTARSLLAMRELTLPSFLHFFSLQWNHRIREILQSRTLPLPNPPSLLPLSQGVSHRRSSQGPLHPPRLLRFGQNIL